MSRQDTKSQTPETYQCLFKIRTFTLHIRARRSYDWFVIRISHLRSKRLVEKPEFAQACNGQSFFPLLGGLKDCLEYWCLRLKNFCEVRRRLSLNRPPNVHLLRKLHTDIEHGQYRRPYRPTFLLVARLSSTGWQGQILPRRRPVLPRCPRTQNWALSPRCSLDHRPVGPWADGAPVFVAIWRQGELTCFLACWVRRGAGGAATTILDFLYATRATLFCNLAKMSGGVRGRGRARWMEIPRRDKGLETGCWP